MKTSALTLVLAVMYLGDAWAQHDMLDHGVMDVLEAARAVPFALRKQLARQLSATQTCVSKTRNGACLAAEIDIFLWFYFFREITPRRNMAVRHVRIAFCLLASLVVLALSDELNDVTSAALNEGRRGRRAQKTGNIQTSG